MKLWSLVFRLLSVLAIVGLSIAPMVTPSVATTADAESMTAMAHMSSMGDDMDCCPQQKQSVPDCQTSCALAALCAMNSFASAPTFGFTIIRSAKAERLIPRDDRLRDPLVEPPPPRPPRT